MNLADILLAGPLTVLSSHPLRMSYELDPDLIPAQSRRDSPSLNLLRSRMLLDSRLGSRSPNDRTCLSDSKMQGLGPHLFVTLEAEAPVLRFENSRVRTTRQTTALMLDKKKFAESSTTAKRKKI